MEHYGISHLPNAEFAVAFKELDKISKHYQDLPIHRARKIIQEEASRNREGVEAFGSTVPGYIVFEFGATLVVILQWYFFLNVTHLSKLFKQQGSFTTSVPWIGLRDSFSDGLLFVVSAILVPAILGLVLSVSNSNVNPDDFFLFQGPFWNALQFYIFPIRQYKLMFVATHGGSRASGLRRIRGCRYNGW